MLFVFTHTVFFCFFFSVYLFRFGFDTNCLQSRLESIQVKKKKKKLSISQTHSMQHNAVVAVIEYDNDWGIRSIQQQLIAKENWKMMWESNEEKKKHTTNFEYNQLFELVLQIQLLYIHKQQRWMNVMRTHTHTQVKLNQIMSNRCLMWNSLSMCVCLYTFIYEFCECVWQTVIKRVMKLQ